MKQVPHLIPDIQRWPITQFYERRDEMVQQLANESYDSIIASGEDIPTLLSQTIYAEKLRCKTEPLKVDPPKEYAYWKKIENELSQLMSDEVDQQGVDELFRRILYRYSEEIHSKFVPKTFNFARKLLTKLFGALYNRFWTSTGPFWGKRETLLDKIKVEGPVDHIRELFDKGTVLILPTHFSNLDSILIGYAIEMLTGLPAFSYGAGLNLYDYEIVAYYMSRLGAYKVDRRKKNPIYAQTLRQFSQMSIGEGLNSIFFPGGTRSRYGGLEQSVKMGLLGTLINAQNDFYRRGIDKKIIIIPLVLSYHFVLEADSLIDQHLKKTGKASYVAKTKRKQSRFQLLRMFSRLWSRESDVTLSFGAPIDVFGYVLDTDAQSIKNGRTINIKEYFYADGKLNYDEQRNSVYTRHLASSILDSYRRENIVLSSHIVSFVAFEIFRKRYEQMDIYSLINVPDDHLVIDLKLLIEQIDVVRAVLIEMAGDGEVGVSPVVRDLSTDLLIEHGIEHLCVYHSDRPIYIVDEMIYTDSLKLLYYYHNRMDGYKLDRSIKVTTDKSARLESGMF